MAKRSHRTAAGVLGMAACLTLASAAHAETSLDRAVRAAVIDYCVAGLLDTKLNEDDLGKKAGLELMPASPAAGPFADGKSMRGFLALRPTAESKAMVDGLSAVGSPRGRCLVRIVDVDGGQQGLVTLLRNTPGWSSTGVETKGSMHQETFRRTESALPYDVGVNVSFDDQAASREDGMRAMISVAPLAKKN